MSLRFFAIPACDPAVAEAELNQLLTASRVLGVERHFVANSEASFWAVCVRIASGPGPLPAALKADQGAGRRVDYREVLNEADFAVFARLRELRKTIAEAEGVPQYAVFTNEHLASMVRGKVKTVEALGRIEGVGPGRVDRYAARFLDLRYSEVRDVGHCKEKPPASCAAARGTTRPGGFALPTATRGTATTATRSSTTRGFALP